MSAPIGPPAGLPVELLKSVAFRHREPPEPYARGVPMIDYAGRSVSIRRK